MNKSMITGIVGGVVAATAIGGVAGYKYMHAEPQFAEVTHVEPITETRREPHQVCQDFTVVHRQPAADQHQIAGTAIGALVGGLLGNQIGAGNGRTLATVAGAAGGGYAGNRIEQNMQNSNVTTSVERRCRTEYSTQHRTIGYKVDYMLAGKPGSVRMDHDPGQQIPVRHGQLVLEPAVTAHAS